MTSREKIENDFISALKGKEQLRLDVLRLLKAAIKNAEIEKKTKGSEEPLTEEEIARVIKREIKKRDEAIINFQTGGRQDLADKESQELEILKPYAPADLSDGELKKIVENILKGTESVTANDFGKVMKQVMVEVGNRADGKRVSQLVKEMLG